MIARFRLGDAEVRHRRSAARWAGRVDKPAHEPTRLVRQDAPDIGAVGETGEMRADRAARSGHTGDNVTGPAAGATIKRPPRGIAVEDLSRRGVPVGSPRAGPPRNSRRHCRGRSRSRRIRAQRPPPPADRRQCHGQNRRQGQENGRPVCRAPGHARHSTG